MHIYVDWATTRSLAGLIDPGQSDPLHTLLWLTGSLCNADTRIYNDRAYRDCKKEWVCAELQFIRLLHLIVSILNRRWEACRLPNMLTDICSWMQENLPKPKQQPHRSRIKSRNVSGSSRDNCNRGFTTQNANLGPIWSVSVSTWPTLPSISLFNLNLSTHLHLRHYREHQKARQTVRLFPLSLDPSEKKIIPLYLTRDLYSRFSNRVLSCTTKTMMDTVTCIVIMTAHFSFSSSHIHWRCLFSCCKYFRVLY